MNRRQSKNSLLLTLFALAALCLCACSRTFRTDAPMTGFSFSHSGMHTGHIYTLSAYKTDTGWLADISLLGGEKEYVLDLTDDESEKLAELADEHQLKSWAGFNKSDPRCKDGTGFILSIDYADKKHLYAKGSNAFPKNYESAHNAILSYFNEIMQNNGIENPL